MAMACLRLLTLRPERPLFSVPALRFFIARSTLADAFFEYFRAMTILPVAGKYSSRMEMVPTACPVWVPRHTRRHPEVRALARLEGWPQAPGCHPSTLAEDGEHLQR